MKRSLELQWQEETIQQWLNTAGIPADAREGLLELLSRVREELSQADKKAQRER